MTKLTKSQEDVLLIHRMAGDSGLGSGEFYSQYDALLSAGRIKKIQSPSSLRSRRTELVRLGWLRRDRGIWLAEQLPESGDVPVQKVRDLYAALGQRRASFVDGKRNGQGAHLGLGFRIQELEKVRELVRDMMEVSDGT